MSAATNVGPFADADDFNDDLWSLMDHYNARTTAEAHLIRVMLFHGDFLNGGLNQVMYNIKEADGGQISDYVQSFDALGLEPFAQIVAMADAEVHVGKTWQSVFDRPSAGLDKIYTAMTYGLPMTDSDRFEEFLKVGESGHYELTDWVARAALKYARDNIGEFAHLVSLWDARDR